MRKTSFTRTLLFDNSSWGILIAFKIECAYLRADLSLLGGDGLLGLEDELAILPSGEETDLTNPVLFFVALSS